MWAYAARVATRPARRAVQEAKLQQVGLDHIHDGVGLLADAGGQRVEPNGPAVELVDQRVEHAAVQVVQPQFVNLEQRQRLVRHLGGDAAIGAHLGIVAQAPQQAQRHTRGAAGAAGNRLRPFDVDGRIEQPRRTHRRSPARPPGRRSRSARPRQSGRAAARSSAPARVVAPTTVNLGRLSWILRAPGPLPTTILSEKSSMAG